MIRTFFAVLFVALFLITCIPYCGIEWILGRFFDKRKSDLRILRYVQWAFRVVMWISGVSLTVLGKENIPKDRAVLYAANHRGIFDIVSAYSQMPDLTGFIAKVEMLKVPLLPFVMRRLYCLFLDRKDNRKGMEVILKSFEYMKQGISMFIFPEGTRNKNNDPAELQTFHNGSFKAAQRVGCPVVPVAIVGAEHIFENHKPSLRPGKIVVHFLPPVEYSDLTAEEKKHIGDHFSDMLSKVLEEDKSLLAS